MIEGIVTTLKYPRIREIGKWSAIDLERNVNRGNAYDSPQLRWFIFELWELITLRMRSYLTTPVYNITN